MIGIILVTLKAAASVQQTGPTYNIFYFSQIRFYLDLGMFYKIKPTW